MAQVKTKQVLLADTAVPARTRKPKPKVAGVPDRSRKRAKDATCFVTEFPIEYSPKQRKKANARFNSGTILYNACLRETLDRVNTMRTDPRWKQARDLPKTVNGKLNKERTQLFNTVTKDVGFNAYSLGSFGTRLRVGSLRDNVLSQEAQTLATRAYTAVADWVYAGKGKPRFKPVARGLHSIETKGMTGSMQLKPEMVTNADGTVTAVYWFTWGKGLVARLKVDPDNPVHQHGIQAALAGMLYGRVVKRIVKSKTYFYAQLVCDGVPLARYETGSVDTVVGLDSGPSTIAVVTDTGVYLERFCDELEPNQDQIRLLQRKLDRQHRAGSPECFDSNGVHRSGRCQWERSGAAKKTVQALGEAHRRLREHRKSLHGNLTNRIIGQGVNVNTENLSKVPWQKRFGKSVNFRAPGMVETSLSRKAESAGGVVNKINPWNAKLSQRCVCGNIVKKPLSLRVHVCVCGVREQRDIWSAFLTRHTSVEGIFNPQPAVQELVERHDIGVGRGNHLPNLRVPPAVKIQRLVPVISNTAGNTPSNNETANRTVRASRPKEHTSGLIPTSQASDDRGDYCEANTQLEPGNLGI